MNDMLVVEDAPEGTTFYHDGVGTNWSERTKRQKRGSLVPLERRPFIAWDGESGSGHGVVQAYHLFACVTPDGPRYLKSEDGLKTRDMLDFIMDVEEAYPDAIHVGFGFGYDINQIMSSLSEYQLTTIHKTGVLYLDRMSMKSPVYPHWRLEWRKNKSLTITKMWGPNERTSVVMFDVFSFFMSSFVKALDKFGTAPETILDKIREGKNRRGSFTYEEIDGYVLPYCIAECEQLIRLMEYFRKLVYGAGFKIKHWHGPGAIASYVLRQNGIKDAMAESPEEVRNAAQYAYAAGRFELTKVGNVGAVWSVDINSAYPDAIRRLPNLARGRWVHVENPTSISYFGVYRIRGGPGWRGIFRTDPAPLWHRDKAGRISFPWQIDGWYWSPEAELVKSAPYYEIVEGWEFIEDDPTDRPWAFVEEMFNTRLVWKAKGWAGEYALKLGMNSLYGKMAQRVGWDKKKMKPPPWHQLEWAGWVTSFTRAKIYRLGRALGWENVVAIETDGVYTTRDPSEINISASKELGRLSVDYYTECIYVQSGLAWLRNGDDDWTQKYRGLDPESLPVSKMVEHLSHIDWDQTVEARTTRFIGIGAALVSRDWRAKWKVWETMKREIKIGGDGKRLHVRKACRACKTGESPMERLHDLIINLPKPGMSHPHFLPWIQSVGSDPPWRQAWDEQIELIQLV